MSLPADRFFRLPLRIANAYLVADGEYTLVDAGTPWDEKRVRKLLWDAGCTPGDLDRVLLTHFDLDHVGALAGLDLGCPVYIGYPDAEYLRGDRTPPLFDRKGVGQRLAARLLTLPDVDVSVVGEGDNVGPFQVYHTPGHTPGHLAYLHEDGVAFLGDLVRGVDGDLAPPLRRGTADPRTNADSIRALADRIDGFEVAAVGHGDPIRTGGRSALRSLADRVA